MQQREEIGVVGAGSWAELITRLLQANQHPVARWLGAAPPAEHAAVGGATCRLLSEAAALGEARLIYLANPAWMLRGDLRELAPHLRGYHRLVHTLRGLEGSTLLRASELIRAETPVRQTAALVGPLHPSLHAAGLPGACVVGSAFPDVIRDVQRTLGGASFRVYGNADIAGVEIAAAAARLVSVAVGLLDALGLGPSVRGTLITRAGAEMARLGAALGARPASFTGLAGLGYVIAQASDPPGADLLIGRALAEGQTPEAIQRDLGPDAVELFAAAAALTRLAEGAHVEAHILPAVEAVLEARLTPAEAAQRLLGLSQMME